MMNKNYGNDEPKHHQDGELIIMLTMLMRKLVMILNVLKLLIRTFGNDTVDKNNSNDFDHDDKNTNDDDDDDDDNVSHLILPGLPSKFELMNNHLGGQML